MGCGSSKPDLQPGEKRLKKQTWRQSYNARVQQERRNKEAQDAVAQYTMEAAMLLQRAAAAHLALTEPMKPPGLSIPAGQTNVVESVIETARGLVKGAGDLVAGVLGLSNEGGGGDDDPPVASRGGGARPPGLTIPVTNHAGKGGDNIFEQGLNSARQLLTQVTSGFSGGNAEVLAAHLEAAQSDAAHVQNEAGPPVEVQVEDDATMAQTGATSTAHTLSGMEEVATASVRSETASGKGTSIEEKAAQATSGPTGAHTSAVASVGDANAATTPAPTSAHAVTSHRAQNAPGVTSAMEAGRTPPAVRSSDSATPANAFGVRLRSSKREASPASSAETTQVL
jgi:hypothetical protein